MIGSARAVTSAVSLRWRPTLAVHEARIALLRSLETSKRLRAFQLEVETARARVDTSAEIYIYPDRLTVADADGLPKRDLLSFLFEQVIELVRPDITRVTARFQHLVPVAHEYDEARAQAVSGLFGSAGRIHVTDFAVLIDGKQASNPSVVYQAEFGIITREDAPLRLSQAMARVSGGGEHGFDPDHWDDLTRFPHVALYVDSYWHEDRKTPKQDVLAWALRRPELYAREADTLVRQLADRLELGAPTGIDDRDDES